MSSSSPSPSLSSSPSSDFYKGGYHNVVPCIRFTNCRGALDFYSKVFGAKIECIFGNEKDDSVNHAEISIGDSKIMCFDSDREKEKESAPNPVSFCLYFPNVDEVYHKCISMGCTMVRDLCDQFYGDRNCTVLCPFGFQWTLATHTKNVSEKEIQNGAEESQVKMDTGEGGKEGGKRKVRDTETKTETAPSPSNVSNERSDNDTDGTSASPSPSPKKTKVPQQQEE